MADYKARSGVKERRKINMPGLHGSREDKRTLGTTIHDRRKYSSDMRTVPNERALWFDKIDAAIEYRKNIERRQRNQPLKDEWRDKRYGSRRLDERLKQNKAASSKILDKVKKKGGLLGLGIAIGSALAKAQEAYAKEK